MPIKSVEEKLKHASRFWAKVDIKLDTDLCWEWQAGKTEFGYGQFKVKSYQGINSHRVTWELFYGEIPDGLWVLHTCDNPACCNPNHLFLGTALDNARDKESKNRGNKKGEHNSGHKLTQAQVVYVRLRYAKGDILQRELAAEMGVDPSVISRIVRNKQWSTE